MVCLLPGIRALYACCQCSSMLTTPYLQAEQVASEQPSRAFNANHVPLIAGVRMLDGKATDALEASSLGFQLQYVDVFSNCWGPKDDGKTFGKPGPLAAKALKRGAESVNTANFYPSFHWPRAHHVIYKQLPRIKACSCALASESDLTHAVVKCKNPTLLPGFSPLNCVRI